MRTREFLTQKVGEILKQLSGFPYENIISHEVIGEYLSVDIEEGVFRKDATVWDNTCLGQIVQFKCVYKTAQIRFLGNLGVDLSLPTPKLAEEAEALENVLDEADVQIRFMKERGFVCPGETEEQAWDRLYYTAVNPSDELLESVTGEKWARRQTLDPAIDPTRVWCAYITHFGKRVLRVGEISNKWSRSGRYLLYSKEIYSIDDLRNSLSGYDPRFMKIEFVAEK